MAKDSTALPLRLLVNAEAFGFGPTAAIADFFPHLRDHFEWMGYVGSGHSLDLQRGYPWDAFHDLTGRGEEFEEVAKGYDLFFTALNFDKAERTLNLSIPTLVYDPLAWYWELLPAVVKHPDLRYLVQGFHGVEERLRIEEVNGAVIVPPLIDRREREASARLLLLNMGGLQNPYWPPEVSIAYARAVGGAFREIAVPTLSFLGVAPCSKPFLSCMHRRYRGMR